MLLKSFFIPSFIIIAAALIVVFASTPLQNTEWAEGVRTELESSENAEGEVGEEGAPDIGVAIYVIVLIKVSFLMGIGVFFTWLVTRIIQLGSRFLSSNEELAT